MRDEIDVFGRQSRQLISYEEAYNLFNHYLEIARDGATGVYEVVSFPINNISGIKLALSQVPTGDAVWQHTDKWHTAAIYIKKGQGKRFSRRVMNLLAHGIQDENTFLKAWIAQNGEYEKGVFPRVPGNYTSSVRKAQKSYILAMENIPENINSHIPGSFSKNETHRTHLISAQTTGIESHRGLLIDFDGWLNTTPMNKYETEILELSEKQDIVWTANIWIDSQDGLLHWKYRMYNQRFSLISSKEWIDDRWTYLWRCDDKQKELANKFNLLEEIGSKE